VVGQNKLKIPKSLQCSAISSNGRDEEMRCVYFNVQSINDVTLLFRKRDGEIGFRSKVGNSFFSSLSCFIKVSEYLRFSKYTRGIHYGAWRAACCPRKYVHQSVTSKVKNHLWTTPLVNSKECHFDEKT